MPNIIDLFVRQPYNKAMNRYRDIVMGVVQMGQLMTELSKSSQTFGTDIEITAAEIHSLEIISRTTPCNLTLLAKQLKIAKPSALQTVKRLEKKELLTRFKTEHNRKEIVYELSQKGSTAVHEHARFQHSLVEKVLAALGENGLLADESVEILNTFLRSVNQVLEDHLQNTQGNTGVV